MHVMPVALLGEFSMSSVPEVDSRLVHRCDGTNIGLRSSRDSEISSVKDVQGR